MKNVLKLILAFSLPLLLFTACEEDESQLSGKVLLSLTDAPIDDANVEGVFITITGITYQKEDGPWMEFEEFEGPETVNLLDLTDGNSVLMGEFEAGPGNYTGLRFLLEAPENGQQPKSNPDCYILYKDGTKKPLFVPSGAQSGYKTIGNFVVPSNGTVEVTADFDVRKSVVEAGNSGKTLLKPVIRIIVNHQAGAIEAVVENMPADQKLVVYTYEDGTYTDTEALDPEPDQVRFAQAVSSNDVNEDGTFILPFLASGTYDLVLTSLDELGQFQQVLGLVEDIEVKSTEVNKITIDLSSL